MHSGSNVWYSPSIRSEIRTPGSRRRPISATIESSECRAGRTSISESLGSESKSCFVIKDTLSLTGLRIYRYSCPQQAPYRVGILGMQQLLHRGAAVTQHRNEEILGASWDDLKSFLVCAKHRSFRNAAEMLGLTSTTLMRRIDRLEERIGCKLFLRDQSGLTLSEEGLAMIGDVTEMERHAFNIFRRVSHASNDGSGTVRVSVTEGPGNFWILPRLIDFQKTYRKITVDLQCTMEHADVARLETDIAIQLEPPTNPDLIVTKIGRVHIYPFVSEDYRKLHGIPMTPTEIRNHRIIKQDAPQLNDTTIPRAAGLCMLGGIAAMKTNSTIG